MWVFLRLREPFQARDIRSAVGARDWKTGKSLVRTQRVSPQPKSQKIVSPSFCRRIKAPMVCLHYLVRIGSSQKQTTQGAGRANRKVSAQGTYQPAISKTTTPNVTMTQRSLAGTGGKQ